MIALATTPMDGERAGLMRWVLPASVAVHVVVFALAPLAPAARRVAGGLPPPPLVLEVTEPPPPPPPREVAPDPAPALPQAAPLASPRAHAPSRAAATPLPEAAPTTSDAPLDFTGTALTNDGPGMAVPIGGGGGRAAPAPPPAVAPRVVAAPAPVLVPVAALGRRPRAPGLDAELERQYPVEARRAGIAGSAVLRVRILPDGRIGRVEVVTESWTGFGAACDRTVRAARWEPPLDHDGTAVTTEITYTCRFEVRS